MISNVDCSGTFFTTSNVDKKHSAGNPQNIITQEFHECGLESACRIVALNKNDGESGEGNKTGNPQNVGKVGKEWKKDPLGKHELLSDISKDPLHFIVILFVQC